MIRALVTLQLAGPGMVPFTRSFAASTELRKLRRRGGNLALRRHLSRSERIQEREGRRVLIVVTDGGRHGQQKNYHEALRAAHDADAVVYGILVMPITNEAGRHIAGEHALTEYRRAPGGRMFTPGLNALDKAFEEILRDLRTQYLIGFYPRNVPLTKDGFHRLEIRVPQPGLRVLSRTGYYGEAQDPAADPASKWHPPKRKLQSKHSKSQNTCAGWLTRVRHSRKLTDDQEIDGKIEFYDEQFIRLTRGWRAEPFPLQARHQISVRASLMPQILETAGAIAREAGALLNDFARRRIGYELKGEHDLVTAADRASEKLIVERSTLRFPIIRSWPKKGADRRVPPNTAGTWIRWTARPISPTVSRSTTSQSASRRRGT